MSDARFSFRVTHTDGRARSGVMTTAHGVVETPAFMPVGTQGAVKAITHRDLESLGAEVLLGNTYHLYLRPGDDLIARQGGLHRFIGWSRPIVTDSGGYQVFSLSTRRTMSEEGAHFRSHLDGSAHLLSPEKATDIQAQLGSDIAMVLDECLAHPADLDTARHSMQRTLRWARRGRDRMCEVRADAAAGVTVTNPGQAQFGIVQGGVDPELREESARETVAIGFDAYAIGGLSVGEPSDVMYDVVSRTTPFLPEDRPRYLMGTGTPADLVESVARGIDMFDCVLPTRAGRHGVAYTRFGKINLKNARHADDPRPLDEAAAWSGARDYSRAYLHHLVKSEEILGAMLLTQNNVSYYQRLMIGIRAAIVAGRFADFVAEAKAGWERGDIAER